MPRYIYLRSLNGWLSTCVIYIYIYIYIRIYVYMSPERIKIWLSYFSTSLRCHLFGFGQQQESSQMMPQWPYFSLVNYQNSAKNVRTYGKLTIYNEVFPRKTSKTHIIEWRGLLSGNYGNRMEQTHPETHFPISMPMKWGIQHFHNSR